MMNKLGWFALGSAVTVVGIGIAAVISDESSESMGNGSSAGNNELINDNGSKADNSDVDAGNNGADADNNVDNEKTKPNDDTDLKPNTGNNSTDETYPKVDKDKLIFSNTNTGQFNADILK